MIAPLHNAEGWRRSIDVFLRAPGDELDAVLPAGYEPVRRGRWGFVSWRVDQGLSGDGGRARVAVLARAATRRYDVVEGWLTIRGRAAAPLTRGVWCATGGLWSWHGDVRGDGDEAVEPLALAVSRLQGFARRSGGSAFPTAADRDALLRPAEGRRLAASTGRRGAPSRVALLDGGRGGAGPAYETGLAVHGFAAWRRALTGAPSWLRQAEVESARLVAGRRTRGQVRQLGPVLGGVQASAVTVQALRGPRPADGLRPMPEMVPRSSRSAPSPERESVPHTLAHSA
ncbi:MAG: hypothetical protein AAGA57_04720 [Planctomycetota bacterium]